MRRWMIVATLALAACGPAPIPLSDYVPQPRPHPCSYDSTLCDNDERVIHEDDPRWDCATMGNLVCGP
jgi:hypothetical protein